ncbi:18228_t:CDS:2, partial [Racocetra persica]
MPPEDNMITTKQNPVANNDVPCEDDIYADRALSSNDKDLQDEELEYAYDSTLEIVSLPVNVFKGNKLPSNEGRKLFQNISWNKQVKFILLFMDRQLSQKLLKETKATDKVFSKISYLMLVALRLLNYTLKTLYDTKSSDDKKKTLKVRKDLAIKVIIPFYQLKTKHEKLFEDQINSIEKAAKKQTEIFMLTTETEVEKDDIIK